MNLRDLIAGIGSKYDRALSMSSEAQQMLRSAKTALQQWLRAGYIPEGSGGKGGAYLDLREGPPTRAFAHVSGPCSSIKPKLQRKWPAAMRRLRAICRSQPSSWARQRVPIPRCNRLVRWPLAGAVEGL